MSAPGDRPERRLAAILMLDVAGFSAMMGRDDHATATRVVAFHAWVRDLVEADDGRVVKTAGDSVFGEFDSIVEAIECAVAIQRRLATSTDEGERLMARIGLHVGDVIVHGDDLYGDGVNIAARLEPLAEPGGLAVSEAVYLEVGTRIGLPFVDAGMHDLKNIDRRVRVYRVGAAAFGYPADAHPSEELDTVTTPDALDGFDLPELFQGVPGEKNRGVVSDALEARLGRGGGEHGATSLREGLDRIPVPSPGRRLTSVRFLVGAVLGVSLVLARTTGWTTTAVYPLAGCVLLGVAMGGLGVSVTRRRGVGPVFVAVGLACGAFYLTSAVVRVVVWVLAAGLLGTGLQRLGTRV